MTPQEVLLSRDSTSVFHAASDGKPSRRRHLAWTEPLLVGLAGGGARASTLKSEHFRFSPPFFDPACAWPAMVYPAVVLAPEPSVTPPVLVAPRQALAATGHYGLGVTAGGLEVRSLRRVAEGHVVQRAPLPGEPWG